jgi:hypothetical protein
MPPTVVRCTPTCNTVRFPYAYVACPIFPINHIDMETIDRSHARRPRVHGDESTDELDQHPCCLDLNQCLCEHTARRGEHGRARSASVPPGHPRPSRWAAAAASIELRRSRGTEEASAAAALGTSAGRAECGSGFVVPVSCSMAATASSPVPFIGRVRRFAGKYLCRRSHPLARLDDGYHMRSNAEDDDGQRRFAAARGSRGGEAALLRVLLGQLAWAEAIAGLGPFVGREAYTVGVSIFYFCK